MYTCFACTYVCVTCAWSLRSWGQVLDLLELEDTVSVGTGDWTESSGTAAGRLTTQLSLQHIPLLNCLSVCSNYVCVQESQVSPLRQGLTMNLGSVLQLIRLASKSFTLLSPTLHAIQLGVQADTAMLLYGRRESNSGPHACKLFINWDISSVPVFSVWLWI